MHRPYLVVLVGMHSVLTWAGAADTFSEKDYFADQPIVLSASRLSQPVSRAPAAVTVITREMIEASGFRHLVDVLRLVPGFIVGWAGGNTPGATSLGLTDAFPHWMQVMVDGRSVYNPAYGHTTWRAIPLTLDDIDRIEVVRGPNAANDGLNSLLGTIHIFTRHASTTQGGLVELAGGDKAYREVNARYGATTRNGSWRLGLLGREDERHGVPQDRASDLQLSFRSDFQPTNADELTLQWGLSRGDWSGTNVGILQVDDQKNLFLSGFANMQWKRTVGEGRDWALQVHHSVNQNEEAIPMPAPLDPLTGDYRTTVSGIQLTYLDHAGAVLRTSLSAEYRLNKVWLPALFKNNGELTDDIFRLSGGAEWNLSPKWMFHAAAMLEHHSADASTAFSPRLALNWLPTREHAFRLGIAHATSALGLYANNIDIKLTSNGALYNQLYRNVNKVDPEKINSGELGYLFSKPEWGINLDVRAFRNRIYGVVDTALVPASDIDGSALAYINALEINQRGLEYQLKWQFGARRWLALSQSWLHTEPTPGSDYYPQSAPPRILSLLATHPIGGVDVSLGYYRVSKLRWLGADFESQYQRLDLRLAKSWKTPRSKIETSLTLQSLLGDEYESYSPYRYRQQKFDRRGYFSLKYEFR